MNIFLNVSLAFTIKLQQNHNTWLSGCNTLSNFAMENIHMTCSKEKAMTAQGKSIDCSMDKIITYFNAYTTANAQFLGYKGQLVSWSHLNTQFSWKWMKTQGVLIHSSWIWVKLYLLNKSRYAIKILQLNSLVQFSQPLLDKRMSHMWLITKTDHVFHMCCNYTQKNINA